ncbi:hypothetical protein J2X60_002986 [Curtobacterium sp. 320]|nr:hypothetical protein [Curtobacterium sp. 320]
MLLDIDWHPVDSYEWWRDVGTGSLGVIAAVLTAAATIWVAIRSHNLAKKVAEDAAERADRDRRDAERRAEDDRADRYKDQLGRVIDSAMTALVAYGNAVTEGLGWTDEQRQLHAASQARLMLVHATANEHDKPATQAVYEEFHSSGHSARWDVRRSVAGLLAGALANVLARQDSVETIEANVRAFIEQEEKAARERSRARMSAQ